MESAFIGLFGVLIGSVIVIAKEWWFDYRKNKKDKEYLCIKVSSMFDKFIHNSYDIVYDEGKDDSNGCRTQQVSLLMFDPELENVNWKSLPVDLMYEVLDFPNAVENANKKINGVIEYESFPPEYKEIFDERQYQYALLGVKAFEIVSKLRREANLPERIYEWDLIGNLRNKISEIEILKTDKDEG